MFNSILRPRGGYTGDRAHGYEEKLLAQLADVYRVAFFLLGNQRAAADAVERAYLEFGQTGGQHGRGLSLRADLLRRLLAAAEQVRRAPGRREPSAAISPEAGCLFRVPRALRTAVILDAIGLEVEEIAEVTGLPAAAVLHRLQAGWDSYFAASSEGALPARLPRAHVLRCLLNTATLC